MQTTLATEAPANTWPGSVARQRTRPAAVSTARSLPSAMRVMCSRGGGRARIEEAFAEGRRTRDPIFLKALHRGSETPAMPEAAPTEPRYRNVSSVSRAP